MVSIRPRVISAKARACREEYRGFRHVGRNVYTFNLRPARLEELVAGLCACFRLVIDDLDRFSAFLDSLAA